MGTILAIYAAIGWALSDYFGALFSRKIQPTTLTFYGQLTGTLPLVVLAITYGGHPNTRDLLLGTLAGVFNVSSYVIMVEGTRRRRMGAVIPTSAVASALLTVTVGLLLGDTLARLAQVGIVLALIGTAFAASEAVTDGSTTGWSHKIDVIALAYGAISGLGFGVIFILLSQTPKTAGFWPVVAMRAGTPLLFLFARITKASLAPTKAAFRYGLTTSMAGVSALAAYTVAVRSGQLSVVSVIALTSPAGTVVIAHLLKSEHTTKVQMTGVLFAVTGVAMLAVG